MLLAGNINPWESFFLPLSSALLLLLLLLSSPLSILLLSDPIRMIVPSCLKRVERERERENWSNAELDPWTSSTDDGKGPD